VWLRDLDADAQADCGDRWPLSAGERTRAARLRDPVARRRFTARCAFVRRVLGAASGVSPGDVTLIYGAHGKPEMAHSSALRFNQAHSENILALALTFNRDVGIDVEVVRLRPDLADVAKDSFAPEEWDFLRARPASERTAAFYRRWTRNEAVAKAAGSGIASGAPRANAWTLQSFRFELNGKPIVVALALGRDAASV
jgi:4'-phosphopantetheinyl transferase